MKKEQFKSVEIGQSRNKAMIIGYLPEFDKISIYNHVQEIKLKATDVEYQFNFNPRYVHMKESIYSGSEEEQICKKSNNNLKRLSQIINNTNKVFKTNHQFIVFHYSLIDSINKWLDDLWESTKYMKYGNLKNDVGLLHDVFHNTEKEWVVIDGNSYFSSIHQSYLARKQLKNVPDEIKEWSKYYNVRKSLGKAYTKDMLSTQSDEYDIQMIQLIALVMEKNMSSWNQSDKIDFMKILYRLLFAITYRNKDKWINANDMFVYIQAIRYLTLPFDKTTTFKQTNRMNYILLTALYEKDKNLEKTTFNIKMFRNLIEGLISKNERKEKLDYVLDGLNEVYNAMIYYQNESLHILKDIDGQSARDRLTKIDSLCANGVMKYTSKCRDKIINDDIDIVQMRKKLKQMADNMIKVYQNYLNNNVTKLLHNNPKLASNISNIYKLGHFEDNLTERDFFLLVMDALKCS